MPTVCCLHKCTKIEELYLEKLSDSSAITPYLLAHILKFLHELKVLALPKQADDDVISIVGLNCPKLECVVLTNTRFVVWPSYSVHQGSQIGISWPPTGPLRPSMDFKRSKFTWTTTFILYLSINVTFGHLLWARYAPRATFHWCHYCLRPMLYTVLGNFSNNKIFVIVRTIVCHVTTLCSLI